MIGKHENLNQKMTKTNLYGLNQMITKPLFTGIKLLFEEKT